MQLVDFKVRVINSEAATAAGVRVVIESRDEEDVWGTVGSARTSSRPVGLPWSTASKCKNVRKSEETSWRATPCPSPSVNCPSNTITPRRKPVGTRSGKSRGTFTASPGSRQEVLLHCHSASERDRRAAPGACLEQHASGHSHPVEADAGLRDALDARDRSCGHRHAGGRRAAASDEEQKTRHDLGRGGLVERIWAWKNEYQTRILGQLKQMGCSCDWARTRFTLDPICAMAVRHTFFSLFRERLIYRGKRLVNWDTLLQTAVADDEVFHETVQGHFWYMYYPVIDPKPGEPDKVTVATTRPETMLGDTAVAVHPDPAAALDKAEAELADRLAAAPEKEKGDLRAALDDVRRRRSTLLPKLEQLAAMARDGRMVTLPLLNRPIPLVADGWAKPELGTGCVKITPAHDPNDYDVGKRQGLPMINILNKDGTLNASAGPYQGLVVMEAREKVVADLNSWVSWPRPRTARSTWRTPIAPRLPSSRCWPISGLSRWSGWPRRPWTRWWTAG